MKPGAYSLELYRGDTAAWEFHLYTDETKTEETDLTGTQAEAQIRDRPGGPKITDLACTITLPNVINVSLSAADSQKLPLMRGHWDLQLTYDDGRVRTIVAGAVFVTNDVTDSGTPVVTPPSQV